MIKFSLLFSVFNFALLRFKAISEAVNCALKISSEIIKYAFEEMFSFYPLLH